MILVGNQRGNGKNLALHLLKDDNERVEVHELRGFCSDNLVSAFNESYAMSRATKCKQHLFSLSLSPPKDADVSNDDFENAIGQVEERLGLTGQPRAIVFHEKEGRRHCHAVWSRIDTEEMKAIQLSFSKKKMQEVSRDLYLEHGWKMPRGLVNSKERDPLNFTLAEWQQSKRAGKDAKVIKADFQDAWAISDSKAAFTHALAERGYKLARGDRRGFVAVDHKGEVYPVSRWANIKTKQVKERLGDLDAMPTVSETKQQFAQEMLHKMEEFQQQVEHEKQEKMHEAANQKQHIMAEQKAKRDALSHALKLRQLEEAQERLLRLRKGLRGLLDRITGEHKRTLERNELERQNSLARDKQSKKELVTNQLAEREQFIAKRQEQQQHYTEQKKELNQDAKQFEAMKDDAGNKNSRDNFIKKRRAASHDAQPRGPTLEH